MSAEPAPVYLLPPRPRPRDWALAGACAGLALGLAEVGISLASRLELPASLAAGLAASDALMVALVATAVGAATWAAGYRPSHSGLVGAVLGIQLFVAVSAPLVADPTLRSLGVVAVLALAIGALGVAAARLADRTERAGVPASGPLVWGATGLLVAGASRLAYDGALAAPGRLLGLGFAAAVIAGGTALAHELGRRRGSGPRMRFGRLLVLLSLATGLLALAPALVPWLLLDRDLAPVASGPANILVAILPGDDIPNESVEWMSLGGTPYELPSSASPRDPAFPRLPNGRALANQLVASGFATALIAREPTRTPELASIEVDDRPGARTQLAGDASWLAAAPLWRGPGAPLLSWLGLDRAVRTPDQITTAATRWLLRWRTSRSGVPFFLRVDFRGPDTTTAEIDAGLGEILDTLHQLDVGATTLILAAAVPAGASSGRSRATLRPPLVWQQPAVSTGPARRLEPGELGAALARVAASPAETPAALP